MDDIPQQQGLYDPRYEHDACGVGFVCNIRGERSNAIVRQGLKALSRLSHRGATGSDPKTGDGAGILIQIPHEFLTEVCQDGGIDLPALGEYGTGLVFLPTDAQQRTFCKDIFSKIVEQEGQHLLGWRPVPVDDADIGKTAQRTRPVIEQIFIGKSGEIQSPLDFERKLYVIRKQVENAICAAGYAFYITNLSSRTLGYKGLLTPGQV